VVICLERCADLHTAQLMPLPLTVSCCSKIKIGFTFLVPAHPGSPGQRVVKWVCVYIPAGVPNMRKIGKIALYLENGVQDTDIVTVEGYQEVVSCMSKNTVLVERSIEIHGHFIICLLQLLLVLR